MLTRITPQSADRVCALILGASGIGKTSQLRCLLGQRFNPASGKWEKDAAAVPEKALVLSAESGLLCVRDFVASGAVEGFEIRSLEEFKEALLYCRSPEFAEGKYRWVFIDSLTEIAARCVESLQRKYPKRDDTFKLWGEYSQTMTDLVKAFRDMPSCSVVFTCLTTQEQDEFKRRYYAPDIDGKAVKSRLPSFFDEVLYMDRTTGENGTSYVVFQTTEPAGLAKDRSGKLAPVEEPNILKIKNKIISK